MKKIIVLLLLYNYTLCNSQWFNKEYHVLGFNCSSLKIDKNYGVLSMGYNYATYLKEGVETSNYLSIYAGVGAAKSDKWHFNSELSIAGNIIPVIVPKITFMFVDKRFVIIPKATISMFFLEFDFGVPFYKVDGNYSNGFIFTVQLNWLNPI
jgi:hypothetical protein